MPPNYFLKHEKPATLESSGTPNMEPETPAAPSNKCQTKHASVPPPASNCSFWSLVLETMGKEWVGFLGGLFVLGDLLPQKLLEKDCGKGCFQVLTFGCQYGGKALWGSSPSSLRERNFLISLSPCNAKQRSSARFPCPCPLSSALALLLIW